jgi:hypothetical protein
MAPPQVIVISSETTEQPQPMPPPQSTERKPGRGNVLNIFQDAFKH